MGHVFGVVAGPVGAMTLVYATSWPWAGRRHVLLSDIQLLYILHRFFFNGGGEFEKT